MYKKTFSEIVNLILIPIIDNTAKRKEFVNSKIEVKLKEIIDKEQISIHKEYEAIKKDFKKKNFIRNTEHKIDRRKVAALFCVAFVNVLNRKKFFNSNRELKYFFVRNVTTNIAIAIIESFIIANTEENEKYRLYVEKYGIVFPIKNYVNNIVKNFILKSKKDNLSFFLLANIFCAIESKSREEFKKINKEIYA